MILPVIAYGHPVLKKKASEINNDYENLTDLISNMFETMYNASGVGIAAPQVGISIRLFIVDTAPFAEDDDLDEVEKNELKSFKRVFINPTILSENGEEWGFDEGCLSIPFVREIVQRKSILKIKYFDQNFNEHTDTFSGLLARVIQHEYDHVEGVLFTDKLSSFKKRLINKKLQKISSGKVNPDYKMHFYKSPKKNN